MRIFIALISSNDVANNNFKGTNPNIIPQEIMRKFQQHTFILDSFNPNFSKMPIDKYLLSKTRSMDAAALLIQSHHEACCTSFRIPFFTTIIDIPEQLNIKNFFGQKLSKLLTGLVFILEQMNKVDNEIVMRLPIRNFIAEDLKELCKVFETKTLDPDFIDRVLSLKTKLLSRKRPRRKSSFPLKYFADNHEKHFDFGKERHAVLETGSPHRLSYEIAGNFRFGKKISTDQHYKRLAKS